MPARRLLMFGAWLVLLVAGRPALAQHGEGDEGGTGTPGTESSAVVAADKLYEQARELMRAGAWPEACRLFAESDELDATATTRIHLGICRERDGSLMKARATYREALALNDQDASEDETRRAEIRRVIEQRIHDLDARLPRLTLRVRPMPEGLEVRGNGLAIPVSALGEPMPLDPGQLLIEVKAPGYKPVKRRTSMSEGKLVELEIALDKAPPPEAPAHEEPGVPVWAWAVGGVGLALVGVGIGFRVDQAATEQALDDNCGPERQCPPGLAYDFEGDNERKNRDFGLFVAFTAGGGAALAAGVIGAIVGLTSTADEDETALRFRFYGTGAALDLEF